MRKIVSFGIVGLAILITVGTWATATTRSSHQNVAPAAPGERINPFEFMKNARDLPAHQYDAH